MLFNNYVFGPVYSRRLGLSLGLNIFPKNKKYCSFNCIYCECGWTNDTINYNEFPQPEKIITELEERLKNIHENELDVITFAGNGEPTLHPQFNQIVDYTISLRNKYFPSKKIALLSNSSTINKIEIIDAIKKIDMPIMKLDVGDETLYKIINQPLIQHHNITFNEIIEGLKKLGNTCIIQTIFLRGKINNKYFDNTEQTNLSKWINIIEQINPKQVMIYPIDRRTPLKEIEKIDCKTLNEIGHKIKEKGIPTMIVC